MPPLFGAKQKISVDFSFKERYHVVRYIIIFTMTMFTKQTGKLRRFFKRAKNGLLTAITGNPPDFMTVDRNAKPLSKAYFSHGRKPVSPFAEIVWSNSTHTYVRYRPNANPQYDNVEGIKVAPNLVVLRCCRGAFPPEVCKVIARKFGGRIPDLKEMRRITERADRLNATLALLGDKPLCRGTYLVADKDEKNEHLTIDIEQPDKIASADIYDECLFIAVR